MLQQPVCLFLVQIIGNFMRDNPLVSPSEVNRHHYTLAFLGSGSERFEEENGTLDDYDLAVKKVTPRLKELMMSSCRLGTETCHNQVSIALVDTISLKCSLVWNQVYIVCRCSCNWMVNTLHDMILCDLFKK